MACAGERIFAVAASAASAFFLTGHAAKAQEAVRMSLASEEAAEARHEAASTLNYYNLKVGPTAWNFSAGLDLYADDNIRLTDSNTESDLIFKPRIDTRMVWTLSEKNSLNLSLGGGYSMYLQHSELDRAFIAPNSELSFDLYVGDLWFNFHDRFAIYDNAYSDPTVTGIADYQRLVNALGFSGLWDLNKAIVKFGYDHANYADLGGTTGQPDAEAEILSASAGYVLRQNNYAGIELGNELLTYSPPKYITDAVQWNMGAFYEGQLTPYMNVKASAGYTIFTPTANAGFPSPGDLTGLYTQITLRHRLNQYLNYNLSAGRRLSFSFYGGTVEDYYLNLWAGWRLLYKFDLWSTFLLDHGSQTFGATTENFDRYGPGIGIGRRITEKISARLQYQYYLRTSDLPGGYGKYAVDVVTLNLRYQF